jgi:hypothetical protein
MAKRRTSYLLLSLASGALAPAAVLPGCSGTSTSTNPGGGAGSGGAAGAAACDSGHPCGLVVNPNGGSGTIVTGVVVMPPSGGTGGAVSVGGATGLVIQPGEAGESGASQGGSGPCGGHFCGSVISLGGGTGEAGAKP